MNDAAFDSPPTAPSQEGQPLPAAAAPPQQPAPAERRLRLWPGLVIIALQWFVITLPKWIELDVMAQFACVLWAPLIGLALLAIWWLFFSRLRWTDRLLVFILCCVFGAALWTFRDPTIGWMVLIIYALPAVTTVWVSWLLIAAFLRWPIRRAGLLVVFLLAWGYFTLLRFDGVDGSFAAEFAYRWTPTAEELFKAELAARKPVSASVPTAFALTLQPGDWPGFRGPNRDSRLTGVRLATDWQEQPPQLVWRHRVGPGWSSFAVVGNHLYTQEQQGDNEVVVCYDAGTGAPLWLHEDDARFSEDVAGPGPRATPTFHEGKIYAQGAAGRLNCLDAATGRVLWSHDITADAGAKVPNWGFAASPLVAQGVVTVFAGGPNGKSVLGYDALSGKLVWSGGEGKDSYSSPQPARLHGVEQVMIATDAGMAAFDPAHGKLLWEHRWPLEGMTRVVQPALLGNADYLIGSPFSKGSRRVRLNQVSDGWGEELIWETRAISPYFNDLVVQGSSLYGFDGAFLTCVSLEDGKRQWRERGYGNGQLLLLADQNLLLVLSEKGEVALVEASPDRRKELCRFKALTGKTWNHPVLAHGKLFVRNGEEAACFRLVETTK